MHNTVLYIVSISNKCDILSLCMYGLQLVVFFYNLALISVISEHKIYLYNVKYFHHIHCINHTTVQSMYAIYKINKIVHCKNTGGNIPPLYWWIR